MKFIFQNNYCDRQRSVIYTEEDYSFDVEPTEELGSCGSLCINTLQLEVDDQGTLLYVWGYMPLIVYEETKEFPLEFESRGITVVSDREFIPGVSQSIDGGMLWPIHINEKRGWVCIGDHQLAGKRLVRFAPDSIATFDGQQLVALWLHPKELPRLKTKKYWWQR